MARPSRADLYRKHELAFRTQYAELKERIRSTGRLLPGTPSTLYERKGTGYDYWYRIYYAAPGRQAEERIDDLDETRARIHFAEWVSNQVVALRTLGFQVADKSVARVVVELYNSGLFDAGLVLVGTLCYMAWLNELGACAVALRTQDVDLARRRPLRLAASASFLETLERTSLKFAPVPGLPSRSPPTSAKLPGSEGLRVDLLAAGRSIGATVPVPEWQWHAQAVPHYDWLLDGALDGALLAGGHCVPVRLPRVDRLVMHKLYSSQARVGQPEKAAKDLLQALTLAAAFVEAGEGSLAEAAIGAPASLLRAARKRLPAARKGLSAHEEALGQLESVLT